MWEGRYKSSLVQTEYYLLTLYRYIELNPVRAGMVDDPADYSFSSYQINALGKQSDLCTPHSEYLALDHNALDRMQNYRALFKQALDNKLIVNIGNTTNKGMAETEDLIYTDPFISTSKASLSSRLLRIGCSRSVGQTKSSGCVENDFCICLFIRLLTRFLSYNKVY